jgi:AcrR family transcriptional regulator
MKNESDVTRFSRGRPRDNELREAALAETRQLLKRGGIGAVTMEAVAQMAQVSRPTLYRWWPDRHALAMTALMEQPQTKSLATSKQGLAALKEQLLAVATTFSLPSGRHIASILAAAGDDSALAKAFRKHFILERWQEGRSLLLEARQRGELAGQQDIEIILDALYGALFFCLFFRRGSLDKKYVSALFKKFFPKVKK